MKQQPLMKVEGSADVLQKEVNQYTLANIMRATDRSKYASNVKLTFLQVTPEKAVLTRKVGNTTIPYVSIEYVERALNFISNFNWGGEIVDKGFIQYIKENKKTGEEKMVYEAWVQCKFWIVLDGVRIERPAFGSWVTYENPAVSRFTVYESAKSIATKSFADTFGIGSDKKRYENDAIREARLEMQDATIEEVTKGFNSKGQSDE